MSNMSYCRFQNTASDFQDCLTNLRTLNPGDRSQNTRAEREARSQLIHLAYELLQEIGADECSSVWELDGFIAELDQEYEAEEEPA